MKKKALVIAGIIVGLIGVILIGLTLYVKSYLQSDKLKALIIPRAEQATGRKVDIQTIRVSIFSGISVQGIHLKEKDGTRDFAAAKEFVLKYDFMPLFSKKLVIRSIRLVDPYWYVTRDEDGQFNFDDIIATVKASGKGGKEAPGAAQNPQTGGGIPFSVIANSIGISNAKVEFTDFQKRLPHLTSLFDAELKVSTGPESGPLKFSGRINLENLDVIMGKMTTHTAGTVEIDPETITFALNTAVGSESVGTKGSVNNYLQAPDVRLDLYSRQLTLTNLMALRGGVDQEKRVALKTGPGKATPGGGKAGNEQKTDLKVAGLIQIDTALYEKNIVKNFLAKYNYSGGVMTIDPLTLNFASGEKIDLSGLMKGDLVFHYTPVRGDAAEQIKKTLVGKMVVDLNKVQIKESVIAEAVALFTGLNDLRRPAFDRGHFDINIRDQKMLISGLLTSPRLKATSSGTFGFDKALNLLTDIEVSPELAAKMQVSRYTDFLESKNGWRLIPLKITGTTSKPSVGLNRVVFQKQLQKGIQGEIEKRLFKEGVPKPQGQGGKVDDLLKGLFGK
jgi:AsmA family